jgi:Predicted methyltransferases
MTKLHEVFIRGDVETIKLFDDDVKGEFTVVLSEKKENKKDKNIIDESVKKEIKKMLKKYSHKDVVEYITKKEKLPKKIVYNYCLKIK